MRLNHRRTNDVVIVEGEWGKIEEINGSYVVLALWDDRRLIVPLQWILVFRSNPCARSWRRCAQAIPIGITGYAAFKSRMRATAPCSCAFLSVRPHRRKTGTCVVSCAND